MTSFLSRLFATPAPEPVITVAEPAPEAVPVLPAPPPGGTQFPVALMEAFAAFQAAASQPEASLERRRAMYMALKHLREAEAVARVTLSQVAAQKGGPGRAATGRHWAPQLQGLMDEMAALQAGMAAELKGRRSRLQGLLHVTRERARDVRGYYPARGRQVRVDSHQARHCVQLTA
ncbi:hypothetical protein UAJ10_23625 [Nitrospirillum sp. BR 11164]|uniref:hypothetical protein n=1 Tax=Nitrospirillum sp. BR 11164 TaxID=3104324 RepID=UPI002AFFA0F4|nr:hypothetical protein [Nitrospirillum sp. BR 11164]MEA1651990.1 hypothetical protein [Nitrospirillum sp. BR 11164]